MSFAVLCIGALALLGIVAAVVSHFQGGADDIVTAGHDCSTCTSADDGSCKLHCLMDERKKKECAEPHTS